MPEEQTKWFHKKEYWAAAALVAGGVRALTKPHTTAYALSDYCITIGFPIAMGYLGIRDANKFQTPSGISKLTDGVKKYARQFFGH